MLAKHTKVLLCHLCQSSTPWKACDPKLTPIASLCTHYATNQTSNRHNEQQEEEIDGDDGRGIENDDDEDFISNLNLSYDDDEDQEGENQVVLWFFAYVSSPWLPLASFAPVGSYLAWKRMRGNSYIDSDDEIDCCSSEMPSEKLTDDDSTSC